MNTKGTALRVYSKYIMHLKYLYPSLLLPFHPTTIAVLVGKGLSRERKKKQSPDLWHLPIPFV